MFCIRYLHEFDRRTAQVLSSLDLRTTATGDDDKKEVPVGSGILAALLAKKSDHPNADRTSLRPGTSSLTKYGNVESDEGPAGGTVRKSLPEKYVL